ncbi:MAG TPA: DUF1360 domain-containing protein [Jatrophihabitantaceae bacterium]|jgi:hypothetical protein|nr:DUF1360 domain-containing protein [Jatrophihabitantaceae bacterium]
MTSTITQWGRQQAAEYRGGTDRPLGGYAALLGIYGSVVAGTAVVGRLARRRIPDRFSAGDIVLLTVATHRLSRTIAKDPVTSPLRAPFTRFKGPGAGEEIEETVRGHGVQHSVGELLGCPMCLAQWCATAIAAGLVIAPRPTRLAMVTLSAVAGADFLQYGYALLQKVTEG